MKYGSGAGVKVAPFLSLSGLIPTSLSFVDVESIDDIPENIVYNKVVTVCEEAFWMLKFKNCLTYTKF